MEVGLSLGSNLGDRLAHLSEARRLIGLIPGISISAQSCVYETSPVDVNDEFAHLPFLNAVLLIETAHNPKTLLAKFKDIEQVMGRLHATSRNAPRPIDIDIIYAGDLRIDEESVSIPHPRWVSRRFVVKPLSDLRPDLRLPDQDKTVRDQLLTLRDDQKVVPCAKTW